MRLEVFPESLKYDKIIVRFLFLKNPLLSVLTYHMIINISVTGEYTTVKCRKKVD